MGLFDQIIGAIDSSDRQANPSQLGAILSTVQHLTRNTNADLSTTQTAISIVGSYVRSALQEKRATEGEQTASSIVNHFAGTSANPQAIAALFSSSQVSQLIEAIGAKTGLDPSQIQMMLPILIPVVLNLLRTGANTDNPEAEGNPVLNSFLDADGDGDVDIADALNLAGGFLNRGR
ncbi:DUF937 domain-containing protein [Oxynema aestuarii]|uniref:DUF937 domain-containing protein n=1 Tax=Oxynema aestuarii AP17 TaxID=2064643 RepID=A0A6H1U504_9CYAN|nr:DUF937 domain-containing protein [Oxynema aestuarii]QIZ73506.1 DUF937 domain-containing protein [Oxynema aestuarii AP17]RMH78429.1 MAG: DUF937 domain-containing protein [Cyanobacteria bacterium J007]